MTLHEMFRRNLRAAIKASGLTIKVVSYRAGYDYAYVRKVMGGAKSNPTLLFVESMAGAIGVPPQELLLRDP